MLERVTVRTPPSTHSREKGGGCCPCELQCPKGASMVTYCGGAAWRIPLNHIPVAGIVASCRSELSGQEATTIGQINEWTFPIM